MTTFTLSLPIDGEFDHEHLVGSPVKVAGLGGVKYDGVVRDVTPGDDGLVSVTIEVEDDIPELEAAVSFLSIEPPGPPE